MIFDQASSVRGNEVAGCSVRALIALFQPIIFRLFSAVNSSINLQRLLQAKEKLMSILTYGILPSRDSSGVGDSSSRHRFFRGGSCH